MRGDAISQRFCDLPAARARGGLLVVQPFCAELEGDDHRKERARCDVQNQRCPRSFTRNVPGGLASIRPINVRCGHRSIDSAATYCPPLEFTTRRACRVEVDGH
jgi:hypothetical protein